MLPPSSRAPDLLPDQVAAAVDCKLVGMHVRNGNRPASIGGDLPDLSQVGVEHGAAPVHDDPDAGVRLDEPGADQEQDQEYDGMSHAGASRRGRAHGGSIARRREPHHANSLVTTLPPTSVSLKS